MERSWSEVDCAKEESQEDAGDGNRDDGAGALSAASEELPLRQGFYHIPQLPTTPTSFCLLQVVDWSGSLRHVSTEVAV